jgi:acyl-CoA thioester hydrolase
VFLVSAVNPVSLHPLSVHTLRVQVQVFDTDAYGVVWHGTYARWLEQSRVALLQTAGYILDKPGTADGLLFPVTHLDVQYLAPAAMMDWLTIETTMTREGVFVVASSVIHREDGAVCVRAQVTLAPVRATDWRPVRKLPEPLATLLRPTPPFVTA